MKFPLFICKILSKSYKCNVNTYEIETSCTVHAHTTAHTLVGGATLIDYRGVVL